jgi:hypothetical protein
VAERGDRIYSKPGPGSLLDQGRRSAICIGDRWTLLGRSVAVLTSRRDRRLRGTPRSWTTAPCR